MPFDASTGVGAWLVLGAGALSCGPAGLRWLRVAQREHYLAGSVTRFAGRWWSSEPANLAFAGLGLAGVALAFFWPLGGLAAVAVGLLGPRHLSIRGRTSPLSWTRRLRLLAITSAALVGLILVVGALLGAPAAVGALAPLVVAPVIDVALALLAPLERRLMQPFVREATARLAQVRPTVVAITGSYGKTSTKNHLAHLLAGSKAVVASPASYNNRAGLARAINEHLSQGTEVFIAEMGTYGPGEIAELCSWCPPDVAVITAIGPVHLERFGSLERIVAAKAEIAVRASVLVLNVDDPLLGALAETMGEARPDLRVLRCSAADPAGDVCVRRTGEGLEVWVGGVRRGQVPQGSPGAQPGNLACALAVALDLGVAEADALAALGTVPAVANRLGVATAPSGAVIVDDTFNANPSGSRAALEVLAHVPASGRRVVVTPGMIELGATQRPENQLFAQAAAAIATDLVIVGRTNRAALLSGAAPLRPVTVRTREEAVAWVRAHLGSGDAVLYENDLPDHYP
jgi:UDP-N-acetylmuramoyl-tripeptide--D-alanyl-D-alanine ligase